MSLNTKKVETKKQMHKHRQTSSDVDRITGNSKQRRKINFEKIKIESIVFKQKRFG